MDRLAERPLDKQKNEQMNKDRRPWDKQINPETVSPKSENSLNVIAFSKHRANGAFVEQKQIVKLKTERMLDRFIFWTSS